MVVLILHRLAEQSKEVTNENSVEEHKILPIIAVLSSALYFGGEKDQGGV